MNELMILIDNEDWIYFKTKYKTADSAFTDFLETCESVGINLDNIIFMSYVLRDSNGDDIDSRDLL